MLQGRMYSNLVKSVRAPVVPDITLKHTTLYLDKVGSSRLFGNWSQKVRTQKSHYQGFVM